jgi:hypothetical protein
MREIAGKIRGCPYQELLAFSSALLTFLDLLSFH